MPTLRGVQRRIDLDDVGEFVPEPEGTKNGILPLKVGDIIRPAYAIVYDPDGRPITRFEIPGNRQLILFAGESLTLSVTLTVGG